MLYRRLNDSIILCLAYFIISFCFAGISPRLAYAIPLSLDSGEKENAGATVEKSDPLNRENTRDAFKSFIAAAEIEKYDRASQYLEKGSKKKSEKTKEIIIQFQALLDQKYFGDLNAISEDPSGDLGDDLDPNEEIVGQIQVNQTILDIKLIRINDKDGKQLWLISQETIQKVPELFAKLRPSKLKSLFPAYFIENNFIGVPLYVWLVGILAFPILLVLSWFLVHFFIVSFRFFKKFFRRKHRAYPYKSARPIIFILAAFLHYILLSLIGLPVLIRAYYAQFISVLMWAGVGWLTFNLFNNLAQRNLQRLLKKGRFNIHTLMVLGNKLLKATVFVVFALIILNTLGFKITTILAGLGIGGIAFALAAQKTIENLFGGLSLLSDQVVRVGDVCKIGGRIGTVEDIGLRSTQIRTLDRTVLYVPNGALSIEHLENYSRRDKFWFRHVLNLRYETSAEQMREILKAFRELLAAHEKIENDSIRVRFIQMAAYSLDIEIYAYLMVDDYNASLELAEELLLSCMEIVEAKGSDFAFPSQTAYLAQDTLTAASSSSK